MKKTGISNRGNQYVVATVKPWNIAMFRRVISKYPGRWTLVTDPAKLTPALIKKIQPRYIFFPHWSWKVPETILNAAECVCFHETDLPYGRGGSPIQNLIVRGHKHSVISAIRMERGLDTGPVYMKRKISLAGRAQDIFERNALMVAEMIRTMVTRSIRPAPQRGKAVVFTRRTPDESDIAALKDPPLEKVYDFIRMLDAETYPPAYFELAGLRFEFSRARKRKGAVHADVKITKKKKTHD